MCLLEGFWILLRKRICSNHLRYWRRTGGSKGPDSEKIQDIFYIVPNGHCHVREDVFHVTSHDHSVLSLPKHHEGPTEPSIYQSNIFPQNTDRRPHAIVKVHSGDSLPGVSIEKGSETRECNITKGNMGLDLCKIPYSCLPNDTQSSEGSESGPGESPSSTDTDSDDDCFNIQELPLEVLHHIFSYLTLPQICHYVAPVCRRWRHLANDPVHWQHVVLGASVTSLHLCRCIRRAPLLKSLSLNWRTDLTLAEVNLFSISCPLLQELNLSYCDNINNTVLDIICEHCVGLVSLNLEGCRMVDTSSIQFIIKLTRLRSVSLSHCPSVGTEGVEVLSENLNKLQKVNIDGIPDITDSAIKTLVSFHGEHLRTLCVDGAALTDEAFGAISQCRLLRTLCVSFGETLTDYTLEYIQNICSLRTLRLCKCGGFSLEGLVNFFSLKTLKNLAHLDLSDCINLHDGAIHSIVQCCGHSLRQLYLCWCWYITDTGLQDIIHNCLNMEVLDLMGLCDIGGNCLVMIPITMPRLRMLDLSQCHQVTDELLVDVVGQLPNLVVFNYYGERIQYCPQTGRRKHRLHRCTLTNYRDVLK